MDRAEKRPSTAFTTVDYDRAGMQVGFIIIPHSPNDDAWGIEHKRIGPFGPNIWKLSVRAAIECGSAAAAADCGIQPRQRPPRRRPTR